MARFSSDSDVESEYLSCSSDSSYNDNHPSLQELLKARFSNASPNFNAVHLNAQSIPAHFTDMLASFNQCNIHAILVSESWLKPCLPSTLYNLPGYHLIRNDRTGSGGGGVAIYLRTHLPYTIISMSPQPPSSDTGEHLFIEVELCSVKILVGVFYSPSLKVNYFSSFEKLLEDLIPNYKHSIIMGDFNTCLLKQNHRSMSLESLVTASGLTILPLKATHYFPNSTPSLLDLIIVSTPSYVISHGQCPADAFSYHDLIFLSYNIRPPKAKSKVILQRNFGGINLAALVKDAQELDWSGVFKAASVDEKVYVFNTALLGLYDLHAPMRRVRIKHLPAPWLTDDIKKLIRKKSMAKTKYKLKPSDENKQAFITTRNRCNRVCRDAQRRYIHESVEKDNPSKVWKFLKSLGVGKSVQNPVPNNFDIDSLNQYFTSTKNFDNLTKSNTLKNLSSFPTPLHPSFILSPLSECDVKSAINSISSNAVGSDGISRGMIVPILDVINPIITHILNFSFTSCTFPVAWKEAHVIPLPKKPNPSSFSEFRPISILPYLSKVLERLIHKQFSTFLSQNSLMNPFQSGFRPGHSTVTALVKITDDIRHGMENGLLTVLSLLDFSSAFNNVDYDLLLGILRTLNISPSVIDWFHSYLHGRRQRIRIDESYSSWCGLTAGVPQGGVLSPLLFAVFINSISDNLTSSYHLYADDLQIYTQSDTDSLNIAINKINTDLDHILRWSKKFGLAVNPQKTQLIIVGSPRMNAKVTWSSLPQVIFDGTHIPLSDTVKNLGIIIDRELSWRPHITDLSRRVFLSSRSLRRLRNFLPTATKITLAESLLLPILDYADACYLDLTLDQLNKLERLQNFCIRFIFGLRKYDHVSEYRKRLKWLPIHFRRNTHILTLLYNILFTPNSPQYLKERFRFLRLSTAHNLRHDTYRKLMTPAHTSSYYDNSFTVQAVKLWNMLPLTVREAKSLPIFRNLLRKHYLSTNSYV